MVNGTALDSDDEDLSEGEELRRAAAAYAKVAKRPQPEVIVLDDSSDEEAKHTSKAPRHVSAAASSQILVPVAPQLNRGRPLHQQVCSHSDVNSDFSCRRERLLVPSMNATFSICPAAMTPCNE